MSEMSYKGFSIGVITSSALFMGFGLGRSTVPCISNGELQVDVLTVNKLLAVGDKESDGSLVFGASPEFETGLRVRLGEEQYVISDSGVWCTLPIIAVNDVTLLGKSGKDGVPSQMSLSAKGLMPSIAMNGDYGWVFIDGLGYKMIGQYKGEFMGQLDLNYQGLKVQQNTEQKQLQDKAAGELLEMIQGREKQSE